ncbi:Ribonuclease 3 protein 2 [Spatholobus suberectus]|nr:Ribonuclease 3 protein 2 [Spatholobus suberectus]
MIKDLEGEKKKKKPNTVSYKRLEFIGDSSLSLAMSNHFFLTYPALDPGHLSLLRTANISTKKLARTASSAIAPLRSFSRFNASSTPSPKKITPSPTGDRSRPPRFSPTLSSSSPVRGGGAEEAVSGVRLRQPRSHLLHDRCAGEVSQSCRKGIT